MRIGIGHDVHSLVAGRRLVLGGVDIPFDKGLLGHSDADVLVHSVCDALLGSAGMGDIGMYFPDTDQKYKNINSLELLKQVRNMIMQKHYKIINLDTTVIAQAPNLSPYRKTMQDNIAQILHIGNDCVNIKFTTSEGLGFVGEGRGIMATCIALITTNG